MFKDVDLHISFPNLTLLNMKVEGYLRSDPFLLPDLSGCERLESITLDTAYAYWRFACVSFQSDLKEKVTAKILHR